MMLWAFLFLTFLSNPLQGQDFCLLFSGEEMGYLEPCGCARPPLGGVAKRHTFLKSLTEPWLAVSLGDLTGHVRRQDELKAEALAQALKVMNYSVHNLGERDLYMGMDVLAYLFSPGSVPLLSSNIQLSSPFIEVVPYKVHEVVFRDRTLRIGFLGILSPALLGLPSVGVKIIPPAEALTPLIKELKDKVDILVLLSHASIEESLKLAGDFPEFHLVVSGHGMDYPKIVKEGNTWVVTPGIKDRHLVLYRYNLANGTGVIETITLDERFKDSDIMLSLLENYQQRLKDEGLLSQVEKFSLPEQISYVGSRACSPCHPGVFQHWGSTLHATAYETLLKVGRAFDPECVVCHVVGLNYTTGFQPNWGRDRSSDLPSDLTGVGCEACHGPGSLHIAQVGAYGHTPLQDNRPSAIRKPNSDGYGKVSSEGCNGCHDPEHGPPFHFESYWEKIRHPVETPIRSTTIR